MKRPRTAATLLAATLLASVPAAQAAPDAFLARVKAKSQEFDKAFKDITVTQDVTSFMQGGKEMRMKVKTMHKGRKMRRELTTVEVPGAKEGPMPGVTTTVIFDGADLWVISPFAGKTKSTPPVKKLPGERFGWQFVTPESAEAGFETVSGRETQVIETRSPNSPFTRVWLDKKSAAIVQGENAAAGRPTLLVKHSDFRSVRGWEMPHKTEVTVNGNTTVRSTVRAVETDQGLAEDLFDASKVEAAPMDMQALAAHARASADAAQKQTKGE